MYNRQYNGNGNSYDFSPYMGQNNFANTRKYYNRGFNRNNFANNNQQQQKKHSGCKNGYAHGDQARPYIRGWKFDKTHGLRAFIASPGKNTKDVKSKNGKTWANWTVKVTGKFGVQLYNCLFCYETKKVHINDLGLIMNPQAPNGGYVGPFYKRK